MFVVGDLSPTIKFRLFGNAPTSHFKCDINYLANGNVCEGVKINLLKKALTVGCLLWVIGAMMLVAWEPSLAVNWDQEELTHSRITRQQIIDKAKAYANYKFYVRKSNLTSPEGTYDDYNEKCVITPISTSGYYVGIPYKWGGNDSIASFQQGLNEDKKAGDKCMPTDYACPCQGIFNISSWAVGVDSSGFISQVWGLDKKYSTRNLDTISFLLNSMDELQPGDILLKQGNPGRVMLFSHQDKGRFYVYEPSLKDWKVGLYSYTLSELSDYKPYRYHVFIEPTQKRLALLIGNSNYQGINYLSNPVNDAEDLGQVLQKLDFEVTVEKNLNQKEMERAIDQFQQQLAQNKGVGLFYFSGHGVQHNGVNYLIPIGTEPSLATEELPNNAIAANALLKTMEKAGNQVNLLILDACREPPQPITKGEMISPTPVGLAYLSPIPGSLIAYAAKPGGIALNGGIGEQNSPYVKHLKKWIQKPNLSLNKVLRKVRQAVLLETQGIQSPGYYDELNEDFYFKQSN